MKFLHAADVHLDSPMAGVSAPPGAPLERLRESTRRALANMVDHALDEGVDFIVIAGDLYDGDWRDYSTGLFLVGQMARLAHSGIAVYIALGNHDAESQLTRQLRLPDNVHVFSAREPQTFVRDDLAVALHGRSFPSAAVKENLALAYPRAMAGRFNIGVLHTAADGRGAHANYAPCGLADLRAKGYDYWALGHVHAREILDEHPHVVFPGNLQGRHVRETGAKGFTAVRVEAGRVTAAEHTAADVVRWFERKVDLSGATGLADAEDAVGAALRDVAHVAGDRLCMVRLILEGRTAAHGELVAQHDRLTAECHGAARRAPGDVWLEKIKLKTRPVLDLDAAAARPDAVGALLRSIDELAGDTAARAALEGELTQLISRLPDPLKGRWSNAGGSGGDPLDALVAAARDLLGARILEAEGDE